jgi:hypothetical protein
LRLRARGLLQTALKIGVSGTEHRGVVEVAPDQASGARLPGLARRLLLKFKKRSGVTRKYKKKLFLYQTKFVL